MNLALRALILDDSKDDADLLVRQLTSVGYQVDWLRVETADGLRAALVHHLSSEFVHFLQQVSGGFCHVRLPGLSVRECADLKDLSAD